MPFHPSQTPITIVLGMVRLAALFWLSLAASAAAQSRPCDPVTCSGHGQCIPESRDAYCFCEEGYQAVDLSCLPAPHPAAEARATALGWRIAELASGEADHDLQNVGKARNTYPFALSRWVRDDGLWCSDFVSWVYRSAGAPFTGGYQGGWLLTNNVMIRQWFQRRGLWVQRGSVEFEHFEPRPGDYVRIHTPRWGHSAIVRYVEGNRLYLIEGNAGGYVRLTHYDDFRRVERIDGFGIMTLPDARRSSAN